MIRMKFSEICWFFSHDVKVNPQFSGVDDLQFIFFNRQPVWRSLVLPLPWVLALCSGLVSQPAVLY